MSDGACEGCLRRSLLLGHLTPAIAALVRRGAAERAPKLAGLEARPLVDAVAGERRAAALAFLDRLDLRSEREALAAAGVETACTHAGRYPADLRLLDEPPAVLFARGGLRRLAELTEIEPAVTVVGGRSASTHAVEVATSLGRELAVAGVAVVSGLALGVDAAAHRGALAAAGGAVAVLGGGVDVAYPRAARALHERVGEHGVLVSELPPGTAPRPWCFPARNRIMAALGRMTVVVECRAASGSLITAGHAARLGRTVGAVPGRVRSALAAGSNRLIRDGAAVVLGVEDVLDELFGAGGAPRAAKTDPAEALEPRLRTVLEAVEGGGGLDALAVAGWSAAEARAALGRLELMGLVVRDGLGTYERAVRA